MTWSDPEAAGQPDEVGFGSARPPRRHWPRRPPAPPAPRGPRWPRWPLILAGAAAVAAAAVLALGRHPPRTAQAQAHVQATVTVSEAGHRLLGVREGWELLGYGPGRAVRVQLARGRVTQTVVPPLASTGAFSFIAGPSQVIIRPWDIEPGYLVANGQPARPLPRELGQGGETLPGPRPGEVWVQTHPRSLTLTLTRLDGIRTGVSMRLPSGGWWLASANGRGGVLLSGVGEVYDVWPGGSRHIGGMLAAVGPTRWLTVNCYRPHRCTDVVTDTGAGTQRRLGGPPVMSVSASSPGVIAPDGATAAVFRVTAGGQITLHLLNLATGADQRVAVPLDQASAGAGTLAWSPDSRWLFVVTAHGGLAAVNSRTRQVAGLGVRLPWLSQIAVRNAPR
jgi:hypothetical protein